MNKCIVCLEWNIIFYMLSNTVCFIRVLTAVLKFGHKIGILKFPAFFQEKELQVTCFKVMRFWFQVIYFIHETTTISSS